MRKQYFIHMCKVITNKLYYCGQLSQRLSSLVDLMAISKFPTYCKHAENEMYAKFLTCTHVPK